MSVRPSDHLESFRESGETSADIAKEFVTHVTTGTESESSLSESPYAKVVKEPGIKTHTEKSVSETNLNSVEQDENKTAFSRKADSRKSLPVGHTNMAFSDDEHDSFMLI